MPLVIKEIDRSSGFDDEGGGRGREDVTGMRGNGDDGTARRRQTLIRGGRFR